jgi:hypothetical protein
MCVVTVHRQYTKIFLWWVRLESQPPHFSISSCCPFLYHAPVDVSRNANRSVTCPFAWALHFVYQYTALLREYADDCLHREARQFGNLGNCVWWFHFLLRHGES